MVLSGESHATPRHQGSHDARIQGPLGPHRYRDVQRSGRRRRGGEHRREARQEAVGHEAGLWEGAAVAPNHSIVKTFLFLAKDTGGFFVT
jgi:hypothetical protein